MGWRKKMRSARRLHRPSLKDWAADSLYKEFPTFVKSLQDQDTFHHPKESKQNRRQQQEQVLPARIDSEIVSVDDFWNKYEGTDTPCLIDNIPNDWPAAKKWNVAKLDEAENVLRERLFKCGEDDDGKSIKVKLKYFLRYMKYNVDDSPLYVFDTAFENDKYSKFLLQDYTVPKYFNDDLFRFISESRRPPYRWVLLGPERSGSCVHIDPLASNAWNTLLVGQKRWVIFPPCVPKRVVKGSGLIYGNEDDEAIHYFMTILPRIKQKATRVLLQQQLRAALQKDHSSTSTSTTCSSSSSSSSSNDSEYDYSGFRCYEFTQKPGQTVFVPHGWWHAVLNLSDTIGVTQNYVSPRNFEASWRKTRSSRKLLAWKWLNELESRPRYQHLAAKARRMNETDDFAMKYDPEVFAFRKQQEEEEEKQKKKQRFAV